MNIIKIELQKAIAFFKGIPAEFHELIPEIFVITDKIKQDLLSPTGVTIETILEEVRPELKPFIDKAISLICEADNYLAKLASETPAAQEALLMKTAQLAIAEAHGNKNPQSWYDKLMQDAYSFIK